jgi:hypothetical protein
LDDSEEGVSGMGKNRETDGSRPAVGGDVSPNRRHLGSRLAFCSALTVLMLGTFVSFGGLSYAASQSRNAVHTLTKVAAAKKIVVHDSSAAGQYHKKTHPGHKQIFTPPSGSSPSSTGTQQAGTLPFTGLSLVATTLVSGLLLLVGIMLRRRERRSA